MADNELVGLVISAGFALVFIFLMILSCYCSRMCRFQRNDMDYQEDMQVRRMPQPPPPPPSRPMPMLMPPPPSRHASMKVVQPMPIETKPSMGPSVMVPRQSMREPQHTYLKVQL